MSSDDEHWATAVRAMAQNAVIAGLVRTHPDREALIQAIAPFAEAHRASLLNSPAADRQLDAFDRALDRLLGIDPPHRATPIQGS